jgi:hypothetical protein
MRCTQLTERDRSRSIPHELFGSRGGAIKVGGDSPVDDFPWSNLLYDVIVAGIAGQLIHYYFSAMFAQANMNAGIKGISLALAELQPVAFQNRI